MKIQPIGMIKISSKKYQLLLTTTNLIIKIKQVNLSTMTLMSWLIVLTKIQLVKYLLKKTLNALNEIKKAEIKNKRLIPKQQHLLNFFDNLLDTILTENNNNNNSNNNNNNDNNNSDNNSENENENKNDYKIKQLNDYFKMIYESKSFEDQINLLKKINYLNECWHMRYYDDDKELNLKIFKLKFTYISNDIDEKLF